GHTDGTVTGSPITAGTFSFGGTVADVGTPLQTAQRAFTLRVVSNVCVAPPDGLVGWWPGDGNFYDIVGGDTVTPHGGAAFAAGKVGQGFTFDGIDDYISTESSGDAKAENKGKPTNALTVDAWVNQTAPHTFAPIVKK